MALELNMIKLFTNLEQNKQKKMSLSSIDNNNN